MRYFRSSLSVLFLVNIYCKPIFCRYFFPTNSAYGILAQLKLCLEPPFQDVFITYNFEANYNLPYTWDLPPYALEAAKENLSDVRSFNNDKCINCTTAVIEQDPEVQATTLLNSIEETTYNETKLGESTRKRKSLITRTDFYHILKDKFQRVGILNWKRVAKDREMEADREGGQGSYWTVVPNKKRRRLFKEFIESNKRVQSGFNGETCLLRLICETNASQLGHINGVLGSVMHITFTPTTSMSEKLPKSYYQAEVDGVHEQCQDYEGKCKENLLDLISEPLHSIIDSMTFNK